ncbi:uncharacterized protein [Parasteatoda tepidariorum]|uniref:uncharacterized protein n=1 Tax=Parasteatoda tepidariorum TaxID=114398 RepID=UPI0039BCC3ED
MDTSPYHQHQVSSGIIDYSNPLSKEQYSRKSSSTHSEESGFIRRDSKSGGSSSWRDSKTDQESSSTSRGEKDSKSSASMEEVLESLLAIPPVSRSSSPTSPRRSKYYVFAHETKRSQTQGSRMPQETIPIQGIQSQLEEKSPEGLSKTKSPSSQSTTIPQIRDPQWTADDARGLENIADDLGKMLDERLKSPPHFPSSSTTASKLLPPFSSPTDEMNHGSFCHSSSTSPLEDDVQSPTSMEVLVPEGEEPELSSIIEDDTKLEGDGKQKDGDHEHPPSHEHLLRQREQSHRPPLQRQSTLPSCSSADLLSQQPHDGLYANPFAGLQPGSYTRGMAEGSLRRPQSLCLVLLHLPCMFCARALAPPPQINSFSNGPARMTCVSEPTTPVRDMICPSSYEPGSCCGQPVNPVVLDNTYVPYLTNIDSNPGRRPSGTTTTEDKGTTQEASGGTPSKKKKPGRGIPDIYSSESHLKCHRPKCSKSLPTEEARVKFRTCANCYTYYCSRQCRKLHMSRHKDHCPQTRISNLCKQVLMKARDDPVSRRHLSLCAKRGLLSRGRGAVKLLFLNPEDALDYLVHGWESAKGQTLYVSRSDLLPQEMGADVFTQVRNFCDKYNPERKFILLAAITVANEIAAALEREVVVRGAKMHLSPSLPEDDVQTLILTITKTDPETGDPAQTTVEDRKNGLSVVVEQLAARGVDLEKLYPHTYRKILRFVNDNEPFTPISIFPTDERNGRVFMCIILPWADADIITNISTKGGLNKSSKRKWPL